MVGARVCCRSGHIDVPPPRAPRSSRRVIFQDRDSEGFASRTSNDQSVDDYYCLSFQRDTTGREALDAVTCASVFSSDKGRFITEQDVQSGYAEPFETAPGVGSMRPLSLDVAVSTAP